MRTVALVLAAAVASAAFAAPPADPPAAPQHRHHEKRYRPQVGKASFYARKFAGRKMADGTPMNPKDDNAASKTLPLGTRALVKNLDTGRSAVVTIEDRGPHVPGRIVDLSPKTAETIGLEQKDGLARVEVVPLEVPQEVASE